jgi:hypothetical protein
VSDQYPPDEFDEIARRGGPVGVHRAPRPWWTKLLAPVLVFLIAGAAAYLVATYLWNRDITAPDEPTPTITESVDATVTPSATPSTTPSSTPSPSETADIRYGAKVAVMNGAGISGLAGANKAKLEAAGFTNVTAGNLSSDKPDANVVVYASDEFKDTAEEVARQLGIDEISLDVTQSGAKVEAQLVSDPSK